MNGYERIKTALQRGQPDRVPLMELYIHPKVVEGLCPGCDLLGMVDQMDIDGVCVMSGSHAPQTGERPKFYIDDWGVKHGRTTESYHPLEGPIKSEADLEHYVPPDPNRPVLVKNVREAVARFKGKRFIAFHAAPDFMPTAILRGLPQFLVDLVENPKLAHRLLDMVSDYYRTLALRAVEAGADGIVLAGDWAFNDGPFISPQLFREFVYPHFKRTVDAVHAAGCLTIKHSDGNLWKIMDMIAESGVDAINPIQPDAGMDLGEMKKKYGHRLCLTGNVNCGHTLSEAPIEEVVRETKDAIRKGGPGGGYIMMSSNSLHSSVKPENYRAMVETTKQYGRYPLDMKALAA
jgi:uroporphyrinogen decarboxylase